ncbi:MAG: 4Fe-4S dicluster domain-containing protein [Desulfobacterales bacterium]|nr:4Fe-4S dicluster domain-containing protein [Desulfobacterales bacterium]
MTMKRRTFLKITGMSGLSIAAGCTPDPEKTLFSLVRAPENMVTGQATWYASTCRECPAGCGILAKNREGRIIKLEGNPVHPVNRGALCMRGQAALQGLYDPDRLDTPLIREKGRLRPISFEKATALIREKAGAAAAVGPGRVRMLTETVGDARSKLFADALHQWRSSPPVIFEPYAYEPLKAAWKAIFNIAALPTLHMDRADLLLGFGADFLETWISPVEYARKFKAMHGIGNGRKGRFFQVSPFQSLTGANADRWFACAPGSQAAVIFGIMREMLRTGRGNDLPADLRRLLVDLSASYDGPRVAAASGMSTDELALVVDNLSRSQAPLVLGGPSAGFGPGALQTEAAALMLNQILDPSMALFGWPVGHQVATAASRAEVTGLFEALAHKEADLLIINNANPLFAMPKQKAVREALTDRRTFTVCFTSAMDETASQANLVYPSATALEIWDEYSGRRDITSLLQPAMGKLNPSPDSADVILNTAFGGKPPSPDFRQYLIAALQRAGRIRSDVDWVQAVGRGGIFPDPAAPSPWAQSRLPEPNPEAVATILSDLAKAPAAGLTFAATPSIRYFDGRGANKSWLSEIPDPITKVAWQSPVLIHPDTLARKGLVHGSRVRIKSVHGSLTTTAYVSESVHPDALVMGMGQGHSEYGRYARKQGANPLDILPWQTDPNTGAPLLSVAGIELLAEEGKMALAHTDGSRSQHKRKIALYTKPGEPAGTEIAAKPGLTMDDFPLTLPIPEGYDARRDLYPPHAHEKYRWGMVVDLDRCIGCGACACACYAENNIGVVGEEQIIRGREMSWLRVERYHDPDDARKIIFLPMMCQHCDNAPCEAVCPVYAPHHSKEGLNNQVYNRCIGTRFCAQNCPYKVRRFNWFDWQWPKPLHVQLNPNVTVRSKGVMEKCSFCIQRIKEVHGIAKNENRDIADGEVVPACAQTCPTGAITFGNFADPDSRVRRLAADPRAYQVMGYLNTKPAVIYLKKVLQEI